MSTHLTLHWDFNFMDGSQLGRLGAVGPSEPWPILAALAAERKWVPKHSNASSRNIVI